MRNKPKRSAQSPFPKGVARPAQRALAAAGVQRLEQLTRFTEPELAALHGMGRKALGLLKAAQQQGKSFAKER